MIGHRSKSICRLGFIKFNRSILSNKSFFVFKHILADFVYLLVSQSISVTEETIGHRQAVDILSLTFISTSWDHATVIWSSFYIAQTM